MSAHKVAAVDELIQRHQPMVRGFLVFLGCPRGLLDDLLQEVFLSVLASRFEHRAEAATAVFLRKVARHLFLKAMHRERRQPIALDADTAENAWVVFERDDRGASYLSALNECLRGLEPRVADCVGLRYREEMTTASIGERLGLSEAGVKSILVRARRRLRECVERRLA